MQFKAPESPLEPLSVARLLQNGLFQPWRDPSTGIHSYLLSRRVAPHQQGFYFVNSPVGENGHFLWFYAIFAPSGNANYGRLLGVVDFEAQETRFFPETQFLDASPCVQSDGAALWCNDLDVWQRGPGAGDVAQKINSFPTELAQGRRPYRLATHLTVSSDGRNLGIDAQIGTQWFVGTLPLDGSPFEPWQEFDRCYNHAQFSPTDPDLLLLAQDFWLDPISGQRHPNQDRLWLIRRGEIARPIFPLDGKRTGTHEWWQADGRHVWYCQWGRGVMRVDVTEEAPQAEVMWPISDRKSAAHAHCSRDGRTIVADIGVDTWDTTGADVTFYNRDTGKCVNIATDLPLPPAEIGGKDRYHIHPHPRFCADDRFIHYTTTVNGRVDVALVAVEELLAATS